MSETKFTPGPWYASDLFVDSVGGNGRPSLEICDLHNSLFGKEVPANAHLIAAAPELYEALEETLAVIEDYLSWSEDARVMGEMEINAFQSDGRIEVVRAALAKARGETQ